MAARTSTYLNWLDDEAQGYQQSRLHLSTEAAIQLVRPPCARLERRGSQTMEPRAPQIHCAFGGGTPHSKLAIKYSGVRSKTPPEGYSVFLSYESSMCKTAIEHPRVPFSNASLKIMSSARTNRLLVLKRNLYC